MCSTHIQDELGVPSVTVDLGNDMDLGFDGKEVKLSFQEVRNAICWLDNKVDGGGEEETKADGGSLQSSESLMNKDPSAEKKKNFLPETKEMRCFLNLGEVKQVVAAKIKNKCLGPSVLFFSCINRDKRCCGGESSITGGLEQ